jgi:hypothetical protein
MRTLGAASLLMRQLVMSCEWDSIDEQDESTIVDQFEQDSDIVNDYDYDDKESHSDNDDNDDCSNASTSDLKNEIERLVEQEPSNACSICWEEFDDEIERKENLIVLQCDHVTIPSLLRFFKFSQFSLNFILIEIL